MTYKGNEYNMLCQITYIFLNFHVALPVDRVGSTKGKAVHLLIKDGHTNSEFPAHIFPAVHSTVIQTVSQAGGVQVAAAQGTMQMATGREGRAAPTDTRQCHITVCVYVCVREFRRKMIICLLPTIKDLLGHFRTNNSSISSSSNDNSNSSSSSTNNNNPLNFLLAPLDADSAHTIIMFSKFWGLEHLGPMSWMRLDLR